MAVLDFDPGSSWFQNQCYGIYLHNMKSAISNTFSSQPQNASAKKLFYIWLYIATWTGKTMQWTWYLCPSKIHILRPNPQSDGVQRWGLWEAISSQGWSGHKGGQWSCRSSRRAPLPLLPYEDPANRPPSVNQEARSASPSILDFSLQKCE